MSYLVFQLTMNDTNRNHWHHQIGFSLFRLHQVLPLLYPVRQEYNENEEMFEHSRHENNENNNIVSIESWPVNSEKNTFAVRRFAL
ncbi:hypothetical protein [Perigonia lusca single nucleopolyhedrovirus]|uniref:Uncharacterized protein n=1 Tax=Perigonia lusca single nucleopolyhedrovirus TaxID=1675865 RepID=A0A0M3WNG1_9ABAC|nr:hypothetical protein [Perigonia lusca single nucleopolyhedrovirus]AKN80638.1 hypothetical protein [Perigonia lusca single nucleopolyhedrovirus]